MSTKIIGFSGRKQSGKNSCCDFLSEYLRGQDIQKENAIKPDYVKLYSFADPLKQFCCDAFGLTHVQCYGTDTDKNSLTEIEWQNMPGTISLIKTGKMTAREVLQYFGTEVVRRMHGNSWVNATLNRIKRESPAYALISDVRFPNEVLGIQAAGGKVVRLTRNIFPEDNHPSEASLDPEKFDHSKFDLLIEDKVYPKLDQVYAQLIDWLQK